MDLHTAGHRRGVVAAPHHAAVEAGRAILAEGGNALEAMVAMAATIAAVYPHMNHIGGDGFWLVREPSGRVRALMAPGRAGANARPRALPRARDDPAARAARGAHRAGRGRRLDAGARSRASATAARLPLADLLGAAIRHAARRLCRHPQPGAADGGEARRAEGRARLRADIPGRRQAARGRRDAQAAGARRDARSSRPCRARRFLSRRRRARDRRRSRAHRQPGDARRSRTLPRRRSPSRCRSRSRPARVFNTPPPTQGLASLIILALFERLRVPEAESFDHVHGLVEATKRAFRVRDRVVTDPDRMPQPVERYLDAKFLDARGAQDRSPQGRALAGALRRRATRSGWAPPTPPGSSSPTSSRSIGSSAPAACCRATGVLMQNRGASFSLDPGALNALAPGRLPFHTLNPALAVLDDGRVMAYGTMGGDGQPQTQAALFTRHVLLSASRSSARSTRRAGCWAAPGARPHTNLRMEVALRRQPDRPPAVGRPRRRGAAGRLFRRHGPCRRGGAASRRHARRRARSARRRRRGGGVTIGHGGMSATVIPRLHSAAVRDIVPLPAAARLGEHIHDSPLLVRPSWPRSSALAIAGAAASAHPHVWVT